MTSTSGCCLCERRRRPGASSAWALARSHGSSHLLCPSTPAYRRGGCSRTTRAATMCIRIPALVHVGGSEVLAFIEGRSSGSDAGHIDIIMKRSTNDGEQWGPIQVVAGGPGDVARGNPSPVYCEKTGKLLLIWNWNNLDLYVQSSDDKGRTWSKPRKFSSMVKRPGWGWVATGPGHAIQLRRGEHKGRIVVPFNSFFADALVKKVHHRQGCAEIGECARYYNNHHQDVRVEIENPLDPEMGILKSKWYNGTTDLPLYVWAGDRSGVFYSDDGGDTWHLGGMVNSRIGSSECQVAETDEGLVISFRVEDKDTGCRKMAFSGDGGLSFEHFFEPQVCIPDPVCQGSVVALDDGRIVTAGPGQHDARKDITLHISHGSVVHNSIGFTKLGMVEAGDGGYSDVAVLPPKAGRARVGVIWEHGFAGGAGYAVVDMPPIEESAAQPPEVSMLRRECVSPGMRYQLFGPADSAQPVSALVAQPPLCRRASCGQHPLAPTHVPRRF
ncbi:unnamed protein product [Prorocentrum cordatum]|uniref:Sialidase domain-containing protein n=1 Tax=Prorocentrum cordatum TaxID=2364126 RepID=A0ABN9U3G7_9DINO|nr:unnamed protein product [Polarella glacialis]